MAAKKKRSSARRSTGQRRRGVLPLVAGLAGALAVALVALQLLPPAEPPTPERVEPVAQGRDEPAVTATPRKRVSAPKPEPPPATRALPPSEPARTVPTASRESGVERRVSPVRRPGLAKVALVIDDCGYDLELMKRFARLRIPMTFAVIPRLEHSESSARAAWKAGKEVILHQPMEPEGYPEVKPGEGALFRGMGRPEVAKIVRENLDSIPYVSGLNNHMGSAATADQRLMGLVLAEVARLRDRHPGLYFLDSRTSAATVAYDTARKNGLPTAMRSVFLDHDESLDAVQAKLEELLAVAEEEGEAIGIGHVKGATLTAIEALVATVGEDEFDFVFASELAR